MASAMARLAGKVSFVTGGGSGIGAGIAERFAKEGSKVVVADLNLDGAKATAKRIAQAGGEALPVRCDVTSEASVNEAVDTMLKQYKRVDVLVNNAGIQHICPISELKTPDWRRVMSVHLDGAFYCTRACLPTMYKQKSGTVLFMGSTHSKTASVLKAPYVTAKHALVGFTRALAKEGAEHGVRANIVCPGFVKTPLVSKQIPEQAAKLGISEEDVVKKIMLKDTIDGEFSTIEEVAEAFTVFASWPSNALSGQSLLVSHGWMME